MVIKIKLTVFIAMCSIAISKAQDYNMYAKAAASSLNHTILFDPWVTAYLAELDSVGKVNLFSKNQFCGYAHFEHFIDVFNGQSDSTFLFEDPLFRNSVQLDSCLAEIPFRAQNLSFKEYLKRNVKASCYVIISKPTLSQSRCYIEVTFCNLLNPSRLHLMLIFNKQLELIHIWRKETGYKPNFDVQLCTEEDAKAFFGYDYPYLFWEDGRLEPCPH